MSNIKVKVFNQNPQIKVRVGDQNTIKLVGFLANRSSFADNSDVDTSDIQDNYIMQYDASTGKYKFVSPSQFLTDAATAGIPGSFINALDTDPNRPDNIDLDGGSF